ncbi:uncharacterized protein LOC132303488 [Cornus florida]|uniref:uncharacterized protein LOC132303488 n=1 Tax=Cornus florida TaxID=4283 RepID=UPI00289E4610|nr:uncharacterized protein LOC132303488 [Cornus florida]
MKLSLKVQDQHKNAQPHLLHNHHQNPLLIRAKIPISVFGFPFLSAVTATDPSDVSFSLSTNFPTGPSVKLSYAPTSTTKTAVASATPPLILTLKSGVSFFGSPNNSPLVISAHCTFSPQNPNPNPIFSLQFKPQFGNFSLCKTTYSATNPNPKANGEANSFGFVPLERSTVWKDLSHLTMESCSGKDSILSGIAVRARTELPVTKRVAVNFRWGVNFPADFGKQLPFLSVNKVGIERVDEVKEVKEISVKRNESNVDDMKVLKGMCFWMRSELDALQKENREMKHRLEEMKLGQSVRNYSHGSDGVGKSAPPVVENSGGFEQWRNKNGGKDNGRKESKKTVNRAADVESELERAIKAASSL